jgi:hypothetical protein
MFQLFKKWSAGFIGLVVLCPALTTATPDLVQRADIQQFMKEMVQKNHFTESELNQWFSSTTLQPKIVER